MKQFLRSLCTLLLLMMWCSVGFAAAGDNFTLVTAESELKAGDVIIIVNQSAKMALSTTQNSGSRGASSVTITENNITSADDTQEITLEGSVGAWYFNVGNGYLYAASSKKNQLKTQTAKNDNSKASLSFKSSGVTIKFLGNSTHNILRYNPDKNGLFNCYESAKLDPVFIYKKAAAKTLTSLAISGDATKKAYNDGDAFDPTGLVVTGTYDDNTTATITNGITWTTTPATLTVSNTSCSVTATVNGVTSPAFNVEGLTVTKTITLSIDPATSTVVKAPVKVTLTANAGATIYYTLNGDEPTTTSTKYTAPFEVTTSGTIVKALAVAEGAENATAEATYTIKPEQPVFSDGSKDFNDAFDVTLTLPESTDASSTIHYAIGKKATADSPLYEGPINISAENDGDKVILHAVVVDQYGNVGMEKYCTYTKTTSFIFNFASDWEGIIPGTIINDENAANVVAGKELKVGGIVMTATNGIYQTTCLVKANGKVTLNVYKGCTITFTAPEGYNIAEITFNGTNINTLIANKETYTGDTWTGNAHAVEFGNDGRQININTAIIKLVAAPATSLTLEEDADDTVSKIEANNGKTVDVKLTRSLKAGLWNTICLPFNVTAEQVESVLKATGYVKEFDKEDEASATIFFKPATEMKAGVPYLIKPTADALMLEFKGVTINNVDELNRINGNRYCICGVFGKTKLRTTGTDLFLNAAGKFVAPAPGKETMKGFRAYFNVPSNTSAAALNINIDGETTGINNIETETAVNGKVYNLNGQYVGNSLNGLKKGIYVVNGKKVIK